MDPYDFWDDDDQDDPSDDDYDEEEDEFVLDCGDPECLMPGPHFLSECHTAEMVDAYYETLEKEQEEDY